MDAVLVLVLKMPSLRALPMLSAVLGVTVLDDLDESALARLAADGFNPSAAVETSVGNFQVWIKDPAVSPKLLGAFAANDSLMDGYWQIGIAEAIHGSYHQFLLDHGQSASLATAPWNLFHIHSLTPLLALNQENLQSPA